MVTQTVGLIGLDICTLTAAGFLAGFLFGPSFTCLIGSEFNPTVLMMLSTPKRKRLYDGLICLFYFEIFAKGGLFFK